VDSVACPYFGRTIASIVFWLAFPAITLSQVTNGPGRAGQDSQRGHRTFPSLSGLRHVHGDRRTPAPASPAHKRAAEYAHDRLAAYGLESARLEPLHFGRGWTLEKLTVEMIEPRYLPLIGYADAWSPSTNGEIVAAPVLVVGKTPDQVDGLRSQLKGAIRHVRAHLDELRTDRSAPRGPFTHSISSSGRLRIPLAGAFGRGNQRNEFWCLLS
jgi:hypothetical protein